jgi:NADPH:quinone reductase-like Zn-dependent oxidoreductase
MGGDEVLVLVRVRAAGVDRGTWHLMTGLPKLMRSTGFGSRRPKAPNPGGSLAGTVEAAGQNATEFRPSDEVDGTCDGSFAEYARARVGLLALKPGNLTFEEAAAIPSLGSQRCKVSVTLPGCNPGRRCS